MADTSCDPSAMPVPFLDDFLPTFDVESGHGITIQAPPRLVYDTARRLDLTSSRTIRLLFRMRGLPASALDADGLAKLRFKLLLEDPPQGFVLGIIGQFWRVAGGLLDFDPTEFTTIDPSGYAKAIWSFDVISVDGVTSRLRTVTRVACTDAPSRRRFLRYWRLIGPFSALIRREALRVIRRDAESDLAARGLE